MKYGTRSESRISYLHKIFCVNMKYGTRSESRISHLHKIFYSAVIPDTAYINHSTHYFSS